MSRNATASWSGYSHQGKIALLIALRKINSLHGRHVDLNDYWLECEAHEDASLRLGAEILEAHQVKAKNGSTTKGAYTDALKLFTDGNEKYLHTTCEITNWDELEPHENPYGVVRYPYRDEINYCPLTSILGYLDADVATLLRNENHDQSENEPYRTTAIQEFLTLLDDKIRYEHAFKAQDDYDISFTLENVRQAILNPETPAAARMVAIRQRLYQTFEEFIEELNNDGIPIENAHEAAVTDALIKIYRLNDVDFLQFLRNINPHTSGGIKFETQIVPDDFFVKDNFYSTFLWALIFITGSKYNLDGKLIPSYFKKSSFLLTSIVGVKPKMRCHAQNILENTDVDFSAYEQDFLITQYYEGSLSSILSPQIREQDEKRFMKMKDLKFIKIQDAIDTLNEA